ncbi:MAG TPA: ABC-2 family transporter protein [Myxococcaceae bacterium]|jgi:ABC-2 type transport system permease protein|nr:ABC-2 family transporter protein [Myxococcaceae bacterium]
MSARSTVRALPTLVRVGFAEAIAYRAEMLVWVLSTTMPLIMLALWSAVAADAPVGRFDQRDFLAYFLATFIVRQLTGAWVAWQMSFEVRTGTLAMRLLRPLHPMVSYAVENLAALPLRLVVALPVAMLALLLLGTARLPRSPALWGVWAVAVLGGWLITFLANALIGCLALWTGSSIKVMDVWLVAFMVFSGYLVPVELFPGVLRTLVAWLPFRYQIGFPVEVMTSAYDLPAALGMLARQWAFVLAFLGLAAIVWRRGLRRFAAYGG